ncbi:hypothetical protein FBQ97_02050, partial [Acidobacteria bacterium ACD]|nr:hypothetical protein [Acidobacteria bacterium ACD]
MTARRRPAPAGPPAPSGGRDEVLHVRVWRERRRDFALMTRVFVRDGARLIEKRALYPEGAAHIGAIAENAEWMRKTWRTVRLPARRPERESGPGSVVFDYVDGTPLDRLLSEAVGRGDRVGLKGLLAEWLALLQLEPHGPEPLARTAFGAWPEFEDERWLRHGNLDPVPANLVRDPDGRHWALDPEWCLGGPVPAAYVLGRCWLNVRYLLGEPLLALIPEEEALGLLGLSRRDFETAQVLEAAFQSWVHGGDRTACLPVSARRSQVTLSDLFSERARDGEQIGRLRSELAAATSEAASLREQLAASEADREGRGRLLEAASA